MSMDLIYNRGKKMNPSIEGQEPENDKDAVRINGFAQVVAMLQAADPEFRESLLFRIAGRDHRLAQALHTELKRQGLL